MSNDLEFEESVVKIRRGDVLIRSDGSVEMLGLQKDFVANALTAPTVAKDAVAEAYAFVGLGYCIKHGISKTKEQIKTAFLSQEE